MKPPTSFREALKKKLTPREQKIAIYGFDILGDMALIEIPDALRKKASIISRTLLDTHPYLSRVYEKVGVHSGKYRVEKTRWLAGTRNPVVLAKEWGVQLKVDPGLVYYSPRLATERQRVISTIKKGQSVAVFFAGVGPYAILAAKHAQPKRVFALEWNPKALPFLRENIRLNKVDNLVQAARGDVGAFPPCGEFDHILMPAPDTAMQYVRKSLEWLPAKGGHVHVYAFTSSGDSESELREKLAHALKNTSRKWSIVSVRKVNDFSPARKQMYALVKIGPVARAKKRTIKKT